MLEKFATFGAFEPSESEAKGRSLRPAAGVARRPRRARPIWLCAAALLAALATSAPAQAEGALDRVNDAFERVGDAFARVGDAFAPVGEALAPVNDAIATHGGQAFDLIIVRPLGVGRVAFGFVCFIPAALFAEVPVVGWRSKTSEAAEVWDLFVGEPFEATFLTPLGEFDEE